MLAKILMINDRDSSVAVHAFMYAVHEPVLTKACMLWSFLLGIATFVSTHALCADECCEV